MIQTTLYEIVAGTKPAWNDVSESLGLSDRVIVNPDAVFRELDGEGVVLDLNSGLYFGLNEVGARIWGLIEAHGEVRRILAALAEEFDAPEERLRHDLVALIEELCGKGLVHVEPSTT